ncbi:Glycoprotein membrane GPI-anchored protein [Quillaja saponaria]|uniref:Glycoprotein membrane GPI-anchored protein n=1 Tax=Quillaja saponaria TaxID=32244 RepID=A0AAD7QAV1_QUISA|nr:Glycoprotein membrane GPI-anchored protein [Quillaja saponaria]
MGCFKLALFLLVSLQVFLLLSNPVQCSGKEDKLLEEINSYRQSLNLPPLNEIDKANCVADEIADELEDLSCENVKDYYPVPGSNKPKFPNFRKILKHCGVGINTTIDGVIMPACVPNLDPTAVLANYTHSHLYTKYLNDSKYSGAGVGSEDDWIIVILSTNTSTGSFSGAASLVSDIGRSHCMVTFLLGLLIVLMS